jgi:hypothetical protein
MEGSEKFGIGGGVEAVQAVGERDVEENPQCKTKNGNLPGI